MFVLMLKVPFDNFLAMSEHFPTFVGCTSTKQKIIKCLAQEHNTLPLVSLKPATS